MPSLARIPFSPATERVLLSLGRWLLFIAIVHFVLGFLVVVGSCATGWFSIAAFDLDALGGTFLVATALLYLGSALLLIVEGVMLVQAKSAFQRVATSDSNDQGELVNAFRRVRVFFMLETLLFALMIAGTLGGAVVTLAWPELGDPNPFRSGSTFEVGS